MMTHNRLAAAYRANEWSTYDEDIIGYLQQTRDHVADVLVDFESGRYHEYQVAPTSMGVALNNESVSDWLGEMQQDVEDYCRAHDAEDATGPVLRLLEESFLTDARIAEANMLEVEE